MNDRQDSTSRDADRPGAWTPASEDDAHAHGAGRSSETTVLGRIDLVDYEGLGGLSATDQAAVAALPRTSALLIVQRGPNAGARFLLDAERTMAGRSVDADIFLDDVTVSRRHAEFVRELDDFVVQDVGSLNGTYVNRDRIERVVLRPGDEVQIGKYRLTFHPSPARGAAVPAGPADAPASGTA